MGPVKKFLKQNKMVGLHHWLSSLVSSEKELEKAGGRQTISQRRGSATRVTAQSKDKHGFAILTTVSHMLAWRLAKAACQRELLPKQRRGEKDKGHCTQLRREERTHMMRHSHEFP